MKDLFKNKSDVCVLWWNRTEKLITVALFNKDGLFIQNSKMFPMDYIVVPGRATLKLLLNSDE